MSLGGRPKEVEQHSYRAAKQLLPGRPPKLIHTLTPSSRHLTHRDAATWCARPSRPRVAGPSPTALHPAVLALMRGCMPNTACPGPAHAAYSAFRLSDSSPSRGLPLLLPFVRHRLSDSSPFRGLPPFRPRAAPAERQLCHPALSALCAAPAELQLCLSGLACPSSAHSWHCRGSRLWRSDSSAAPSTGAGH